MVCYNKKQKPSNWYHYDNCIQPNNLRNFDCKSNFQQKYPFATIHFLISLLESVKPIKVKQEAIIPLLFCDGVCNNLFGYPENCLDWFEWLGANEKGSLLYDVFYKDIPFSTVMQQMNTFFKARDRFNSTCYYDCKTNQTIHKSRSRSGHHMIISLSDGTPANIIKNDNNTYNIFEEEKTRILGFINLMAELMGWRVLQNKWNFSNLKLYKFKKESMGIGGGNLARLNQTNYSKIAEGDCFSMAITAVSTIEYTRDIAGFFRK